MSKQPDFNNAWAARSPLRALPPFGPPGAAALQINKQRIDIYLLEMLLPGSGSQWQSGDQPVKHKKKSNLGKLDNREHY